MEGESVAYAFDPKPLRMDVRTSFTATFMCAGAAFARRAADIEAAHPTSVDDATRIEHRGLVVAAITQAVSALESECWEITHYGPGHHLGSNGIDTKALALLTPQADRIDRERGGAVKRYQKILKVLDKPALDAKLCQNTDLLVTLRNELVHYKSKWGEDMETEDLVKALRALRHPPPPFVGEGANFFPHKSLSAACAKWAVRSAGAFLEAVYDRLGIPSPLAPYASHLTGL